MVKRKVTPIRDINLATIGFKMGQAYDFEDHETDPKLIYVSDEYGRQIVIYRELFTVLDGGWYAEGDDLSAVE